MKYEKAGDNYMKKIMIYIVTSITTFAFWTECAMYSDYGDVEIRGELHSVFTFTSWLLFVSLLTSFCS